MCASSLVSTLAMREKRSWGAVWAVMRDWPTSTVTVGMRYGILTARVGGPVTVFQIVRIEFGQHNESEAELGCC